LAWVGREAETVTDYTTQHKAGKEQKRFIGFGRKEKEKRK
jgi:hypothetical protein